ncbi:MAG: hypothetical protein ABFD76_05185 [Smithella sp.]
MNDTIASPATDKEQRPEDKTASAEIRFGKDCGIIPKLSNLAIDTDVTIIIKGKIKSFEHDPNSSWNKDIRFSTTLTSCEIEKQPEINSLDDAIAAGQEKRKI